MGLLLLYERLIIGIANQRSTVYNNPMNTISVDADKSVRAEIESAIFAHIDERIERSGSMSGGYKRLWTEIRALMGSGGKRIRSRIVVLSYQMFGNEDVSMEDANRVRGLLRESGALDQTEQAIAHYTTRARAALDTLDINPAFIGEVNELIVLATERKK